MSGQAAFRINDRIVHPMTGSVEGPAGTKHLEPRVMELLTYLARHAGQVVSREDIIRDVWRGTLVTDDVITRSISQIRRALTNDWRKTPVIDTVPKRGYRLVLPIESADPPFVSCASVPTVSPVTITNSRNLSLDRYGLPLLAVLSLCVLIAGGLYLRRTVTPSENAAAPAPPTSLLITPFVTENGGSNFGQDLNRELIDQLGTLSSLKVIGPNSSSLVMRAGGTALHAARELNVSTVVTGTVNLVGDQTNISLTMLDASSGRVLHGHDYHFKKDQLREASREIAGDVASMLGIAAPAPQTPDPPASISPESYQLYLEARNYVGKNEAGALQQACGFLQQAIKLDPNFAEAHAALAIALMLQVDFGNRSVHELAPQAQREIDQALSILPKLATAHAAQGLLDLYEGHLNEAEEALREATALKPNYAQAHIWLGLVAQSRWQIQRSAASFGRALDIEPLSAIAALNMSRSLDIGGSYERAEAVARTALEHHPEFGNLHWSLGHILWQEGRLAAAEAEYLQAVQEGGSFATLYGQMALLQIDLGHAQRAQDWILRGERIEHNDEMVWLARMLNTILARNAVTSTAARNTDAMNATPFDTAARASVDFYQGNFKRALHGFDQAKLHEAPQEGLLQSRWLTLAGHAPALDEAAAHILGRDGDKGRELLSEFATFLAGVRADGLDSPGIDYEEAAISSLQGDAHMMAVKLDVARQHGWREDWFVAIDPKLAGLHQR